MNSHKEKKPNQHKKDSINPKHVIILYSTAKFVNRLKQHIKLDNNQITVKKLTPNIGKTLFQIFDNTPIVILEINSSNAKLALGTYIVLKIAKVKLIISTLDTNQKLTKIFAKLKEFTPVSQINNRITNYLTQKTSPRNQPTPNFVSVNNMQLAYYIIGTKPLIGNKPVLFFYHGIMGRTLTYLKLLKYLADNYTIIGIDAPYHGLSDPPTKQLTYTKLADILYKATLQIANKHKFPITNATFMGHSMGGGVATYITYKLEKTNTFPQRLILLNSVGFPITESKVKLLTSRLAELVIIPNYDLSSPYIRKAVSDALSIYYDKLVNPKVPFSSFIQFAIKSIPAGIKNIKRFNIKTPTTFVTSTKEPFVTPKYALDYLTIFNCSKIKIIDGVHIWPVLEPQKIKEVL